MTSQSEIWWVNLGDPTGSEAAYRRPMLVIQADFMNRSRIATVLCVPLTSNLKWVNAPGNVLLRSSETGLQHDSVANVTQTAAVNRFQFSELAGRASRHQLAQVFKALDDVLGR